MADLLGLCPSPAVQDLAALNGAFISSQASLLRGQAVLNPRFTSAGLLSGSDGDLIVDGCYIDIKATTEPNKPSPSLWPWELLGYVLLDHDNRYGINSVGLYLARQAMLVTWDLDEFASLLVGQGQGFDLESVRSELHLELTRRVKVILLAKRRPGRRASHLRKPRQG
jgi:hypothetical protein